MSALQWAGIGATGFVCLILLAICAIALRGIWLGNSRGP
jgi:hypothetical protein